MPLLTSPIDGSPMKEIERYGIKLDMCATSGGIWFDKGEVEKLIHFVREEAIKEQSNNYHGSDDEGEGGEGFGFFTRKDKSSNHNKNTQPQKRRRESPLSDLLDIFEF